MTIVFDPERETRLAVKLFIYTIGSSDDRATLFFIVYIFIPGIFPFDARYDPEGFLSSIRMLSTSKNF